MLGRAGLDGDMDVLRARAYLDLLLGQDSRPAAPGARPRHPAQVRHATCVSPVCRRPARQPASQCDFEHNVPDEAGGRTFLCNGGPKYKR